MFNFNDDMQEPVPEHDRTVEEEFGPDAYHICNFPLGRAAKLSAVCDSLDSTFMGVAISPNGDTDRRLIGVYSSDTDESIEFWETYYNTPPSVSEKY